MTPEGKVKELVKKRMQTEFPNSYRFMPVQNGMGAPALDIYFCVSGLFVAVETKRPGGKPTDRQKHTMMQIWGAGGLTYVVDGPASLDAMIINLRHWTITGRPCT